MWCLILSLLYFTAYTVTDSLFSFLCGKCLFIRVGQMLLCVSERIALYSSMMVDSELEKMLKEVIVA
jgi:hypothetical protein